MMQNRKKLDQSQTRRLLLEVAAKLFALKGLDGVTTRDIARKSKLNVSLISYYFGGKEGLYKEVMNDFAIRAKNELEVQLQGIDFEKIDRETFLANSKRILSKMVEMKIKDRNTATLLHRELVSGLPFARSVYEESYLSLAEKVVRVFQIAQVKGILREDINLYVLFLSMAQAIDGFLAAANAKLILYSKCPDLETNTDEYVNQIFNIFIRGACCEKK
jgi:AcrR family transcriptional regulator